MDRERTRANFNSRKADVSKVPAVTLVSGLHCGFSTQSRKTGALNYVVQLVFGIAFLASSIVAIAAAAACFRDHDYLNGSLCTALLLSFLGLAFWLLLF